MNDYVSSRLSSRMKSLMPYRSSHCHPTRDGYQSCWQALCEAFPEWSDLHGEFATTYRPRTKNGEQQLNNVVEGIGQGDKKSDEKGDKKSDEKILEFLKSNPSATIKDMRELTGLSSGGILKVLNRLKRANRLRRIGPDKGGHWEVLEVKPWKRTIVVPLRI